MAGISGVFVPIRFAKDTLRGRKSFEKRETLHTTRKFKRNKWRILRRKRSKLKYWTNRKNLRVKRKSENLLEKLAVCNITDKEMDVTPQNLSWQPLQEVSTWQTQHQLSYWKSRAIALEYENRILYQRVKNTYYKQIQDYVEYVKEHPGDDIAEVQEYSQEKCHKSRKKTMEKKEVSKPPSEKEDRKLKEEMMTAIYGSMAPRIMGMETAIQLNYDLYMDKHKPPMWPNMPLKWVATTS